MIKFLVVCFLLGTLQQSSPDEWPTKGTSLLAAGLDDAQAATFGAGAAALGLHFPDREALHADHLGGAYIVFWRRAQGRPLPYPIDPVLGTKEP